MSGRDLTRIIGASFFDEIVEPLSRDGNRSGLSEGGGGRMTDDNAPDEE